MSLHGMAPPSLSIIPDLALYRLADAGFDTEFNLKLPFMSIIPIGKSFLHCPAVVVPPIKNNFSAAALTFVALLVSLVTIPGHWEHTALFPLACFLPILALICYTVWGAILLRLTQVSTIDIPFKFVWGSAVCCTNVYQTQTGLIGSVAT